MREKIIHFPIRKPFSELSLDMRVKAILSLSELPMTPDETYLFAGIDYENLSELERRMIYEVFEGAKGSLCLNPVSVA